MILHRAAAPRRGFSMIETSVACAIGTLLVYLVAMSWSGFARGAALIVARAELAREADLAFAHLAHDLRTGGTLAELEDGFSITGADPVAHPALVYKRALGHLIRKQATQDDGEGERIAYHVTGFVRAPREDPQVWDLALTLRMPGVFEDRSRSIPLERTFHFLVVQP